MSQAGWPEAANRRLRNLLWKGLSAPEMVPVLGRTIFEIELQLKKLGIHDRPARRIAPQE